MYPSLDQCRVGRTCLAYRSACRGRVAAALTAASKKLRDTIFRSKFGSQEGDTAYDYIDFGQRSSVPLSYGSGLAPRGPDMRDHARVRHFPVEAAECLGRPPSRSAGRTRRSLRTAQAPPSSPFSVFTPRTT